MAFLKWLVRLVLASMLTIAGTVKLTPNLSQDMHDYMLFIRKEVDLNTCFAYNENAMMVKEYIKFATVSPLKRVGLELRAEQLMQYAGVIEVICGPLLIIGSRSLRFLSHLVLMAIMTIAIYTLYALQYKPVEYIPAVICVTLLLLDRHVLDNSNEGSDVKAKRS